MPACSGSKMCYDLVPGIVLPPSKRFFKFSRVYFKADVEMWQNSIPEMFLQQYS